MPAVEYIRADLIQPPGSQTEEFPVNQYDRDLGRIEAILQSVERQIEELKQERKELKQELEDIKTLINQVKGGSRAILWIGSFVSGGIGAALLKFAPVLMAK